MSTATTLVATDLFPDGTVVAAYLRSAWPTEKRPTTGSAPYGDVISTATAASGQIAFVGLAEDTQYVAAAQVGGVWQVIGFTTMTRASTFEELAEVVASASSAASAAQATANAAAVKSANLSDLASASTARGNLGAAGVADANVFTANQSVLNDGTDTWPGGGLNLANKTDIAAQVTAGRDGGATPFLKPSVNFYSQSTAGVYAMKWQMGHDVGVGAYGSSGDKRDDFYLLHRWAADTSKSADVLYVTDETYPRVGVRKNTPVGQLHIGNPDASRPTLIVGHDAAVDNWLVRLDYLGSPVGGFWHDSAGAGLKLGIGVTTEPSYALHVAARSGFQDLALIGSGSSFKTNETYPVVYASATGGTYPFDNAGNLVIQPRSQTSTFAGDVVLATGRDALIPALVVTGSGTSTTKNVGMNVDPAAQSALYGGGYGVFGFRNCASSPAANSGGRPSNGAYLYVASQLVRSRTAGGESFGWGAPRSGGEAGIALGLDGTYDVKLLRLAAGVLALGSGAMTAPTVTGHCLVMENVSAAPSTNPVGGGVIYCEAGALKYRGTSGTITTLGAA